MSTKEQFIDKMYPERKNAEVGFTCIGNEKGFLFTKEQEEKFRAIRYEDGKPIEQLIHKLDEAEKNS